MPIEKKEIIKQGLSIALAVARSTNNPFDDIIVLAAVKILDRVFSLGMGEL